MATPARDWAQPPDRLDGVGVQIVGTPSKSSRPSANHPSGNSPLTPDAAASKAVAPLGPASRGLSAGSPWPHGPSAAELAFDGARDRKP